MPWKFLRRTLELTVLLFAVLGFVFVPLGKRTALEHVRALIAQPEAAQALSTLGSVAEGMRQRLAEALERSRVDAKGSDPSAEPVASTTPPRRHRAETARTETSRNVP